MEEFLIFFSNNFPAKGYLKRREEDPTAVVCLGDSAYHRSTLKGELGLGLPVPQRKDGVQQKVRTVTVVVTLSRLICAAGGGRDCQS